MDRIDFAPIPQPSSPPGFNPPPSFMATKRILIIDDDEAIQIMVKFGLQMRTGWDVLTAGSGAQGIEIAQGEQPDAILLDIIMPDLDGIDTLNALQTHPATRQIPVIFLTATDHTSEQQRLHELGVNGVITKPFNSLNLSEQIAQMLHWSHPL